MRFSVRAPVGHEIEVAACYSVSLKDAMCKRLHSEGMPRSLARYFFHRGIASDSGEMVSSVSVKKNIRDLVAAEDAGKPLSDQEIAQVLRGQGLTIARRTVAKYREELGILPSHQRRLQPKKR